MGQWRHHVKIKDVLDDEAKPVIDMGKEIASRLSRESCFREFPLTTEFKQVSSENEMDKLLEKLYNFADLHRIWIA